MDTGLVTETVPVADLRPHPDNPRLGDTDAIAESLRVNGQFKPIVISRDNIILAGNHTYAAAAEMGWATLDAVRLPIDGQSPAARRIMLADNRTSDLGSYDEGLLLRLVAAADADNTLVGTGYTADDLADLAVAAADSFSRSLLETLDEGIPLTLRYSHDDYVRVTRLLADTPDRPAAVLAALEATHDPR